ncbi:F1F0 ATP synthase subunit e, mitochondrial [Malassezia furfur]|uniref:ATP synthase F(0) complex subunit e, mitochondrial n=1 Tax=Malassezia furfur TaxID=55194 RepID=A0ABY8EMR6_MALFU|nr:TIM11 [Malassezia furfur]WFD46761.1 F1F0 ATP synthase subunit e, mitochondrial [Malassezia furfur]
MSMSPTPLVNVVRYSALIAGIGYGILHRRSLQKDWDAKALQQEQKQKDELIKKAKEEYAKLKAATQQKVAPVVDAVTNPDDPNFDLEKAFERWEKE